MTLAFLHQHRGLLQLHSLPYTRIRPAIKSRLTTIVRLPAMNFAHADVLSIANIQEIRDTFRSLLLPGLALFTFVIPAIVIGLVFGPVGKGGESNNSNNPSQTLIKTTRIDTAESPGLPDIDAALVTKLLISIIIDLIGDGSLLIPGAGDASDLLWAPVSALLVRFLYQSNTLALVNLVEELLPFTDIIPTATLAFVIDYCFWRAQREEEERKKAGRRKKPNDASSVIDVKAIGIDEGKSSR